MKDTLGQLERLAKLRDAGTITDAEFEVEKAKVLADPPPSTSTAHAWPSTRRILLALFVVGAIAIAVLLLMPPPKRQVDAELANANTTPVETVVQPDAVVASSPTALAADVTSGVVDGAAGTTENEQLSKPQRGRCMLQVGDRKFIDGDCDIVFDPDGSFDIQDRYGSPTYFARVMRDGESARGFWNEEPGAPHAHTDLGDLTHEGDCWVNQRVRVCAWL